MKRTLLCAMLLSVGMGYGQNILSENFDGGTTLPTGWKQYNVDGLTPNSSVNFIGTNAWSVQAFDEAHGNSVVAISWYAPAGQSDDWLVTPLVSLPAGGNYVLEFDNIGPDASYPDNYEVWVTTTGDATTDFLTNGTKLVSAVSNAGDWATKSVDLSAYAGQDIYIAFRDVANDKYIMLLDNITIRVFAPNDVRLNSVTNSRFALKNTNNSITYSVTNRGSNAVTGLTVAYSDGTNTTTDNVTTNIAVGQTKDVTIPTPLNYANVVELNLAHSITKVNTVDDTNPVDNNGTSKFNTISEHYDRNVVIEEGTGTWCGWCVRGLVAMDYMQENYPDFIGIAVHNNDPMAVTEYDNGLGISGFPGGKADRTGVIEVSTQDFESALAARKLVETGAKVSADISSNGNNITIVAKANFNTKISNNQLRLAVVMAENDVKGTASGYAQTNYYSGGDYGPMGGYENLAETVPAADMVYNHVGRALLGGFNGQANSVDANVTESTLASYTFNYTIPANTNKNKMYAVVMLIDNETGEIMNAARYDLAVAATNDLTSQSQLNVYPNPVNNTLNVSLNSQASAYTVTVYDLSGKALLTKEISNNAQTVSSTTLDVSGLAKGSYMVSFATATQSYTKHFVKE